MAGRSGPRIGGRGASTRVRRLAVRTRVGLDAALRRLRASALPIVQCGVAAGLAWLVASDVFGHERPFFAPIAAVISLGVSLANRLRRAVELIVGVSLGVLVGDLIVSVIGSGWWQIALVVTLAVAAAVFADGGTLLVNQAGASAVLVATLLPPGQTGGVDRCVDALIGGLLGVAVAALIPSDPVAPVRRTSRTLLVELAAVLRGVAGALRDRDADAALAALQRARRTQPLIDSLRGDLHGGREVTAVSPLHRRRRRVMADYAELAERADYAMRNTRVVARRAYAGAARRRAGGPGPAGRPRRAGLRRRPAHDRAQPGGRSHAGPRGRRRRRDARQGHVRRRGRAARGLRAGARRPDPLDRAGPPAGDRADP